VNLLRPGDVVVANDAATLPASLSGRHSRTGRRIDVTENKTGLTTATRVAIAIRKQIRDELNLTASAGVAPNKFLAKIASDWRKPDGLFVIQPAEVENFLTPLPVGRIPGVGKVTEQRLEKLGVRIVSDLRNMELDTSSTIRPLWETTI
jgi:DNA polymerase-4